MASSVVVGAVKQEQEQEQEPVLQVPNLGFDLVKTPLVCIYSYNTVLMQRLAFFFPDSVPILTWLFLWVPSMFVCVCVVLFICALLPHQIAASFYINQAKKHVNPFDAVAELVGALLRRMRLWDFFASCFSAEPARPLLNPNLSHVPFTDNSVYPATQASRVNVDVFQAGGKAHLTVTDDGVGLRPEDMHRMFSLGFSSKPETDAVQRGFGFKAGALRLGSDILVFTHHRSTNCAGIGFLSTTFNAVESPLSFKLPIIYWNRDGSLLTSEEESSQSLSIMFRYGPFKTPQDLFDQFKSFNKKSGVRVMVCGLRQADNNASELDFESDWTDIQHATADLRSSLREYCNLRYQRLDQTAVFVRDRVISAHASFHRVDLTDYSLQVPLPLPPPIAVQPSAGVKQESIEHYGTEVGPAILQDKKRRYDEMNGAEADDLANAKRTKV